MPCVAGALTRTPAHARARARRTQLLRPVCQRRQPRHSVHVSGAPGDANADKCADERADVGTDTKPYSGTHCSADRSPYGGAHVRPVRHMVDPALLRALPGPHWPKPDDGERLCGRLAASAWLVPDHRRVGANGASGKLVQHCARMRALITADAISRTTFLFYFPALLCARARTRSMFVGYYWAGLSGASGHRRLRI